MNANDSNITPTAQALLTRNPEPPIGTVVIDGDGKTWQRGTRGWYAACYWSQPYTWLNLLCEFGIAHVFADSARISDEAANA